MKAWAESQRRRKEEARQSDCGSKVMESFLRTETAVITQTVAGSEFPGSQSKEGSRMCFELYRK